MRWTGLLFPQRATKLSLCACLVLPFSSCVDEQPEPCKKFLACAEDSPKYSDDEKALFDRYYSEEGECWSDWDLGPLCEERCDAFLDACLGDAGSTDAGFSDAAQERSETVDAAQGDVEE